MELILSQGPDSKGVLAVYADRSPRLLVSLLATIKAGFAFRIIDPKYPIQRIVDCLNYVRAVGILNGSTDLGAVERLLGMLQPRKDLFWINIAGQPGGVEARDSDRKHVLKGSHINAKSLLYVTFTSGTTGLPKAVWGTYGPVSHFFEWQQERFQIAASDRVSVLSGFAHDPLLRDVLMPVWVGCSSWFPSEDIYKSPGQLYAWLRDTRITIVHLTPSLCQLL